MKIKIGSKVWSFKDSYDNFTLIDIKKWMPIVAEIERLNADMQAEIQKYDGLSSLVDMGMSEQAEIEADRIDFDIDFIRINLASQMIDLLDVCCNQKGIKFYLENTDGVTYPILVEITQAIANKYGAFVDYFNACQMVEAFKHRSKKDWVSKRYKVQDMDKNTLMRDALASVQAQTAFNYKLEISAGAWDNICKFVALVARPIKQEFDIAFSNKSFINSKALASFNHADKATFYQQELDKDVEKRCADFENLLLPVAIGVLMCYEKKKQILESVGNQHSKAITAN